MVAVYGMQHLLRHSLAVVVRLAVPVLGREPLLAFAREVEHQTYAWLAPAPGSRLSAPAAMAAVGAVGYTAGGQVERSGEA